MRNLVQSLALAFIPALALTLSHPAFVTAQIPGSTEEIAVTGDAPFAIAPDWVAITARLEQTSATATEATSSLAARTQKLSEALKAVDAGAQLRLRGDKYLPATPGPLALKSGAPMTIERSLAIETGDVQKSGKLIDTALASGSAVVTDVSYTVRTDLRPLHAAIELASKRAKEKAELSAASLGVKLGAVISSVVTEEPEGEAIRAQLQTGQPAADYGDRVQHVYVTVRYSIDRR